MKTFLFILVFFIAVTSTLSGLLMISDPAGELMHLPLSLLQGTPFKNYLLPGILLAVLIGGVNIIAVYKSLTRNGTFYNWSIAGGTLITIWIIVHMILIQSLHWLHVIYLGSGILIILIAYQLKGKWVA